MNDALARARGSSHPLTLAHALFFRAYVHQLRREAAETRDGAEAVVALCREEGMPFYQPLATIWRGWAVAALGEIAAGLDAIQDGLAAARATGMEIFRPQILAMLAEIRAPPARSRKHWRPPLRGWPWPMPGANAGSRRSCTVSGANC